MPPTPLADDVRRFVLTSMSSVPHLEALLLLQREIGSTWTSSDVAARLYLSDKVASEVLRDLCSAGLLECDDHEPVIYRYRPRSDDLSRLVQRLADAYATNLVQITHLIHSRDQRMAQRLADAFKWRKDP